MDSSGAYGSPNKIGNGGDTHATKQLAHSPAPSFHGTITNVNYDNHSGNRYVTNANNSNVVNGNCYGGQHFYANPTATPLGYHGSPPTRPASPQASTYNSNDVPRGLDRASYHGSAPPPPHKPNNSSPAQPQGEGRSHGGHHGQSECLQTPCTLPGQGRCTQQTRLEEHHPKEKSKTAMPPPLLHGGAEGNPPGAENTHPLAHPFRFPQSRAQPAHCTSRELQLAHYATAPMATQPPQIQQASLDVAPSLSFSHLAALQGIPHLLQETNYHQPQHAIRKQDLRLYCAALLMMLVNPERRLEEAPIPLRGGDTYPPRRDV